MAFRGDLGRARVHVMQNLTTTRRSRAYLLDRMKLGILTLADGYPQAAEQVFQDVYDVLRTQGINADKTVASVVINEDLKFWKGEPFEQAMAFCYIGMAYGELGDWGNVRAASESSLFQLRDFGGTNAIDLATRAAKQNSDKPIDEGYRPVRSNFALGYLLSAVASRQMGRDSEAAERFNDALAVNPGLAPLVAELRGGDYNVLFVVDYGQGPQKIATGPDNAVTQFVPLTASDPQPLVVNVAGVPHRFPAAIDLNPIAASLMWNNLEDIRIAKSYIGTGLIAAGAATAALGGEKSDAALYAGLAMIGAGLFAKAGAHADTRYCEIMPQRVYLAPVKINSPADRVSLMVQGQPQSQLIFTGIEAPLSGGGGESPGTPVPGTPSGGGTATLRYIRLCTAPPSGDWPRTGQTLYANPYAPDAGQRHYPFLLGGHSVEPPSDAALTRYQQAGYLTGWTLGQLQDIYLSEGVEPRPEPSRVPSLHLLEGGRSLACPIPGSVGYARLFGQPHGRYQPVSPQVQAATAAIQPAPTERTNP